MKAKLWCALIAIGLMSISIPQAALGQEPNTTETELSVSQQKEAERAAELNQQAIEFYQQGQYSEATTLLEEALQITQKLYPRDHPDVANSLNNLALLYSSQGRYRDAEPLYQRALAMIEKLFPNDHSDVATSLNNLAGLYSSQGRYRDAEPLMKRALAMMERLFPNDHPNVATSLNNLAGLYNLQGKYSEAEPLYKRALAMMERLYPKDHPNVATNLNNLALLYSSQGRYRDAEPLYKRALAMRERLFPNDHPNVANSLNSLAELYSSQGRYRDAEPLMKRALAMYERLFSNDHPDVANSLNNLAELYSSQGRYRDAEPLYKRALAMRERLFSNDHPDVANSLNNLAGLYSSQGRYRDAEPLLKRALAMYERLFPNDHPAVATSLGNLALLYRSQGRYRDAEPLLKRALAIDERLFPNDHPDVATNLNDLALLYNDQGRYRDAEPLYKRALAMYERLFPNDHPFVANSLNSLAELYSSQGRYRDAEPLYKRALAMYERFDHPDVAYSLNNLALLYKDQGRYRDAEPLLKKALAMNERLFPNNHPFVESSFSNIGLFYQAQSQYPQALDYLTQAAEIKEAIIAENLLIGSEQQKKQFLNLFQGSTDTTISFHLQAVPENLDAAQLALTTILRRKGRILDATGQALQTLRDNLDPESEKLFVQLASTQTELSNLSSRPLPDDATQRQSIQTQQTELDREIKQLEAQLSSRSAEFRQETTPVTIAAVQQAIPQNAALVEFIQYRPFDPKESKYSEPRYAVYVLLPSGDMQWQDLGEASGIDTKIKCFRDSLSKKGDRGLGAVSSCPENFNIVARELDEILMKPVRGMVGNATHLLLSPDSQLNTLPFAALVDEEDKYLVENYLITYLTSGKDLLRLQLNQDKQLSEPLLMANPTYSSEGIAVANADNKADKDLNRGRRSGELATLEPFTQLDGTKIEGEAIAQIVPNSKLLTEQKASENNLKLTKNPEFLHLATHGFFLPAQPEESNNDRNNGLIDNQTPVFSTAENPLLRSGLALAGFNQRDSGDEDGVLTALEVTGLNLRGTKLVVTSACETGLGDVQAGEGIYGLRRAFTLAGAQSQLMSLWKVSDEGTKDLMVNYYTKIQNGEARGEAFRQVQLEMLQSEKYAHPFYWAAFIPSGSWLPLDSGN